jgi:putative transposase
MNCPHCATTTTTKRAKKTKLGYATFFCPHCRCTFNERTGTPFNYLEFPTDIVLLVVSWRLRYKLSLRDLAELFLERGFVFTHEAVRDWEERFAPLIADQLRAKQFFKQAMMVVGYTPDQVTTDGHTSYPRAVRETLSDHVQHRTNKYLNNRLEQDHRGIKQRYYPMRGFGAFVSAARFCRAFDELRQYFRSSHTAKEAISLAHQRQFFRERLAALQELMGAVSSIN